MYKKYNIKINKDKNAVSNVIGALLVITLLTMAIAIVNNSYVPKWTEENEANHFREVQNEFLNLKTTIDLQILKEEKNSAMFSPITLGNNGLIFFDTGKIEGTLEINSGISSFNITDVNNSFFMKSSGIVKYKVSSSYFPAQEFVYENGAVIINQSNSNIMKVSNQFYIDKSSGTVKLTLINIAGKEGLAGSESQEIKTTLTQLIKTNKTFANKDIIITINSYYLNSWEKFYNNTLKDSGLIYNTDFTISKTNELKITIKNVKNLEVKIAFMKVSFGMEG